jgi:uncharacterized SAM-dependent methyltransferase
MALQGIGGPEARARALRKGRRLLDALDRLQLAMLGDGPTGRHLNLLNNVNRIIGSDFSVNDWRHRAFFHARHARIEMHLEARQAVSVHWPGGMRSFQAGERIHTENSHKYTPDGVRQLLTHAGFGDIRIWTDPRGWFAICLAHATADGVRQ